VLADDEALLRTALAALLPMEGDITVLAEAQDGRTAIAATLSCQWCSAWRSVCRFWCRRLRPPPTTN